MNQNNEHPNKEENRNIVVPSMFDDNGKILDVDAYIKRLESNDTPMVILPSGNNEEIKQFLNRLKDNKNLKNLSNDLKITINDITTMLDYALYKNVGSREDRETLTSKPTVDGKELILKSLQTRVKKGNISSLKLKLEESLGIGTPIHIPLWHSGFWITLSPLKDSEKINLQLALSEEINRVGKMTHALIFSNYTVLFAKIILDTIKDKIVDTSLSLEDDDDIFDFIKIQDLNVIIWGLLKSIHPSGFNYIIYCKNSIKISEDKTPSCTFRKEVILDLNALLRVDMEQLSLKHQKHMLKRSSGIVSKEDVEEYQNSLDLTDSENYVITENDTVISLNIKSPTITRYLEYGEHFIDTLRDKAMEILENGSENSEDRIISNVEEAEKLLMETILLQIYVHYVEEITINGISASDISDVSEMLEIISNNNKYKTEILNKIISYIDKSLLAIVGIPTFTCPVCKESQSQDSKSTFRSFIGLDLYSYFFTMLAFQYQKALVQSEIE